MDGDTSDSTFSVTYMKAFPHRFVECFIAQQNLIGVGIGMACRDRNIVFCSSYACFLTRGFDQIREGAISQTNCNFVGSHGGVSNGMYVCMNLSIYVCMYVSIYHIMYVSIYLSI